MVRGRYDLGLYETFKRVGESRPVSGKLDVPWQ